MRVERVDVGDLRKGKAVIVVNKKGDNKYMVDGIVLHTATVVAEDETKISILDELEIGEEDKIIYICGHGNKKEKTIGGIGIREIARKVIEAGYKGEQTIVITSCEVIEEINDERREWRIGKRRDVKSNKCMLYMFKEEIEKEFPSLKGRGYVKAYGNGSTITVDTIQNNECDNSFNGIEVWVLKEEGWVDRIVSKHLGVYQRQVLRRVGKNSLEINIGKINKKIEDKEIEVYKRGLINGKLYWVDKLATWVDVLGYSLGVIIYMLLMMHNIVQVNNLAEIIAYTGIVSVVINSVMIMVSRRVRDYSKVNMLILHGVGILKSIANMMFVVSILHELFKLDTLGLVVYALVAELLMLGVGLIEGDL